jgi:hypothetical protein
VILQAIVQRWLMLGWLGRLVAIAVALYGLGWVVGNAGMDGAARQLGGAAIFVASLIAAWLFIRLLWNSATAHHRWPRR